MATTTQDPLEFLAGLDAGRPDAGAPDWLRELRREGRLRFQRLGLPDTRREAWRNTSLAPLMRTRFGPAPTAGGEPSDLPELAATPWAATRLVFVDGHHRPALSSAGELPDGVWVGSLARALQEIPERVRPHLALPDEGPAEFLALNDALLDDGAVLLVPDGVRLEQPIQFSFLHGANEPGVASHPRTLIVLGRDAGADVVEVHAGAPGAVYLSNAAGHTLLGDNARLEHVRLQLDSHSAYHISSQVLRQGRDSALRQHNVNLGGRLVRHNLRAVLDGEGGDCNLFGLVLTDGEQHVDNHTTLDHARPHCDSRELYKSILSGDSRSVFSGRIIVREGAQKTDAKQSNPNLLLSSSALAHTRPQLEIYADDVRCTHGATVGQIDDDAVFYLRSRGIAESDARRLLIEAFAGEVVGEIRHAELRDALSREVARRLEVGGQP